MTNEISEVALDAFVAAHVRAPKLKVTLSDATGRILGRTMAENNDRSIETQCVASGTISTITFAVRDIVYSVPMAGEITVLMGNRLTLRNNNENFVPTRLLVKPPWDD